MDEARSNAAIVTFENTALGSASEEFMRVDQDVAFHFIRHLDKIVSGRADPGVLVAYGEYGNVRIYRAEIASWIMIYAVEDQSLGDRKLTVLFCGRDGVPSRAGGATWDGEDAAALRRGVIEPRAAAWFK